MRVETGFAGEFEVHLTVAPADAGVDAAVGEWARAHGVKFTRIVLERGRVPVQPMLTWSETGTLDEVRVAALARVKEVRGVGVGVRRVKIEAAVGNVGVPPTDAAAKAMAPGLYFEHHVKLRLDARVSVAAVRRLCAGQGGHVSWNARRVSADGWHERFVTQRCFGVGRATARGRLDALVAALEGARYDVVDVEEEFVVHDDNPAVDGGWAKMTGAGA